MNKLLYYTIVIGIVWSFSSCKKMDSIYEEYIVPNGYTYPGKALNPIVYAGKNRVKISWLHGSDRSVIKARIFWNNYTDSVEIDISGGKDTISHILENLPENTYSFFIKTYDKDGNVSIPVEVIGTAYGEIYEAGLSNRSISSAIRSEMGLSLKWGGIDTTAAYATEVRYTDTNGKIQNLNTSAKESTSSITEIKDGTTVQYRTIYIPNNSLSIDTFYTGFQEISEYFLDKKNWRVINFSTQHDAGVNGVKNFIDGTDATRWHSRAGGSSYPHFATIDMGVERTVTQFGVWRTTFENGGDSRAPNKIQLLVSVDNTTWIDLGIFDFNRFINGEQFYPVSPQQKARFFKFVAVQGPENNLVMGEISVYGL